MHNIAKWLYFHLIGVSNYNIQYEAKCDQKLLQISWMTPKTTLHSVSGQNPPEDKIPHKTKSPEDKIPLDKIPHGQNLPVSAV